MPNALRLALALTLTVAVPGAAALARQRPALPGAAEELRFTGTEPFWGGRVRSGWLTLDWPENEQGERVRVSRRVTRGTLIFAGVLARRPHFMDTGRFTITVVRRSCSDGMSDRTYPYEVRLRYGASGQWGCGWTRRRPYREDPSG